MRRFHAAVVAIFIAAIALPVAANLAGHDGADPGAESRALATEDLDLRRAELRQSLGTSFADLNDRDSKGNLVPYGDGRVYLDEIPIDDPLCIFNAHGNFFIYKWDVQRTQALSKSWSLVGRLD